MFILAPVALLFGTALAVVLLRRFRPRFRYSWLVAVGTTGAAGLLVSVWQPQLPLSAGLTWWRPAETLPIAPAFSINALAWPYAMALLSLVLAVLLTAPMHEGFPSPTGWATSLCLAALGLLAIAANDALTLVLVWAALDLAGLALLLVRSTPGPVDKGAVAAFSVRLGCIAILLLQYVLAGQGPVGADFASATPGDGLLLLLVAALRLGVVPVTVLQVSGPSPSGGTRTTLELASAASSFVLLSRIPSVDSTSPVAIIMALVLPAVALCAGWMWLRAPDAISGRGFGMLGIASLAAASCLRGSPEGATGWGVTLILAFGALALSSVKQAWLNRGLLVGAWSLSSLPFSLTATAWNSRSGGLDWNLPLLLVAQALLVAAFARQATRPGTRPAADVRSTWASIAYRLGIVLLLAVQLLLGAWGWHGALQGSQWISGMIEATVALLVLWAIPRIPALSPVPGLWMPAAAIAATGFLQAEGRRMFRGLQSLGGTITAVLEGEAGIIWSLLLLVLFVSVISGRKP